MTAPRLKGREGAELRILLRRLANAKLYAHTPTLPPSRQQRRCAARQGAKGTLTVITHRRTGRPDKVQYKYVAVA